MTNSINKYSKYLALAAFGLQAWSSNAAITLSGDPGAGAQTLSITANVDFDITTSGVFTTLVFEDWADPNDGGLDGFVLTPGSFQYQIDRGAIHTQVTSAKVFDNLATTSVGSIGSNDVFIVFDTGISVTAGQTLTLLAQSWTTGTHDPILTGWNTAAVGTFEGTGFVSTSFGSMLSDPVVVPEADTYGLIFAFGGLAVMCLRSQRKLGKQACLPSI